MDYDFQIDPSRLQIPSSAYKSVKRCQFCNSIYLNDKICEECGRARSYHPIGEPFSSRSFYGLKERYIEGYSLLEKYFPVFEDNNSLKAQSYLRNLAKRFADLITAFNTQGMISTSDRKLFYVESLELIDEMLRYRMSPKLIQSLIEDNDGSLVGQELLLYLQTARENIKVESQWYVTFLNYRFWGVLRLDFLLKVILIVATVGTVAVVYRDVISSQLGK